MIECFLILYINIEIHIKFDFMVFLPSWIKMVRDKNSREKWLRGQLMGLESD